MHLHEKITGKTFCNKANATQLITLGEVNHFVLC